MPLEAPKLDTRTFDEIYREALLRIPRYTPEWTDFNESDPGVTLLQLFSWLTEMMLYEMNQIPERNYIKFLQLLNMELRPAQPATAKLTFTVPEGSETSFVRRGAQILAQPPESDPLIFETNEGLSLIKRPLNHIQVFDGTTFTVVTGLNQSDAKPYRPFGWNPQIGSALYLGFGLPEDEATPAKAIFPEEMQFHLFLQEEAPKGSVQSSLEANKPTTTTVNLIWEYKTTETGNRWRKVALNKDDTIGFSREGAISLAGPRDPVATVEGKIAEPCYWLRCRLAEGNFAKGRIPVIDFLRPNVVTAVNLATVRDELLGISEGLPDQVFQLRHTPVAPHSIRLWTEADGVPLEQWQRVDDFLASGANDPHFVLNPTSGIVRFGDGRQGRVPVAGSDIVVQIYRYGGGTNGNVLPDMITTPIADLGAVDVTNERPAVGGRDEEDVDSMKNQAPRILRSRNRAVTLDDFAALAEHAGGVARATAVPLMHPEYPFPEVKVPGAITVVIVPDNEEMPPIPTTAELKAVARYLNQFRLLTSELYVKGPSYFPLQVNVEVAATPFASFDAVKLDVQKAVDMALHPLGRLKDGRGPSVWRTQFGMDFHPTDLYRVIQNIDGVHTVQRLEVTLNGRPVKNNHLVIPVDGLVYGNGQHEVHVVPQKDFD